MSFVLYTVALWEVNTVLLKSDSKKFHDEYMAVRTSPSQLVNGRNVYIQFYTVYTFLLKFSNNIIIFKIEMSKSKKNE